MNTEQSRALNEIILRFETGDKVTNDVSMSGNADNDRVTLEEEDDDEDWIPLDNPTPVDSTPPVDLTPSESSSKEEDKEMVVVEQPPNFKESEDFDVLAEIFRFLQIFLHQLSLNNPLILLAALFQCFAIVLMIHAYFLRFVLMTVIFVYYLPSIHAYVERLIEEKRLNELTYAIILTCHGIQIKSLGYVLNYINHFPLLIQGVTYSLLLSGLGYKFRASNNDQVGIDDLPKLYSYINIFLNATALFFSHHCHVENLDRMILAAICFNYMGLYIMRGKIEIYENFKLSLKTYSYEKAEKVTQNPENSIQILSFLFVFLYSDSKNVENSEFSLAEELRKVDTAKLSADFNNYEKLIKNLEVSDEFAFIYYVRNAIALLAFLDGNFFINIGAVTLIAFEIVLLLNDPLIANVENKPQHHLFFGNLSNLAILHDRFLSTLSICRSVLVSVNGYQATMAAYDTFVALKNIWNVVSAVRN